MSKFNNYGCNRQILSPCKDCEKRFVGCHDYCKNYLDYKAQLNAVKQNEQKHNESRRFEYDRKVGSHVSGIFKNSRS